MFKINVAKCFNMKNNRVAAHHCDQALPRSRRVHGRVTGQLIRGRIFRRLLCGDSDLEFDGIRRGLSVFRVDDYGFGVVFAQPQHQGVLAVLRRRQLLWMPPRLTAAGEATGPCHPLWIVELRRADLTGSGKSPRPLSVCPAIARENRIRILIVIGSSPEALAGSSPCLNGGQADIGKRHINTITAGQPGEVRNHRIGQRGFPPGSDPQAG
jgi:hypothetical protein